MSEIHLEFWVLDSNGTGEDDACDRIASMVSPAPPLGFARGDFVILDGTRYRYDHAEWIVSPYVVPTVRYYLYPPDLHC